MEWVMAVHRSTRTAMVRTEQTVGEAILDHLAPYLVRATYWVIWTFGVALFAWTSLVYGVRGLFQGPGKR
jgi:hypothetical protein